MLDGATPRAKKHIPIGSLHNYVIYSLGKDETFQHYDTKESRKDDIYLFKYEDLPPYFQFNPYILRLHLHFM